MGALDVWVAVVACMVLATSPVRGQVSAGASARSEICVVTGADDAATLRLACASGRRTLRLASVRAPRPGTPLQGGEPYGTQGRNLVRGWLIGRRVEAGGGTARMGAEDLRLGLLSLGLVEWTGGAATPAALALRAAEREARLHARGLWSHDAWRRFQKSVREPLLLPAPPPLAAGESLGNVAARVSGKSEAVRRAAFEAAMAQLEAQRAAAPDAAPAPAGRQRKPDRR